MAGDRATVRRRRLGTHGMMFRRRRIFAQLREGFTDDEYRRGRGARERLAHPADRLAGAAAAWRADSG